MRTLIVARPAQRLSKNESQAIRQWLLAGGTLILLTSQGGDREIAGLRLPQTQTLEGKLGPAYVVRSLPLTRGVRRVAVSGTSVFVALKKRTVSLLVRKDSRTMAVVFAFGKGRVIAASDPTVFSNLELSHEDNARFAYNLASVYAPVSFDEAAQGYSHTENVWHALPRPVHVALLLAGCAALLALIGSNVRFGPLIPLPHDEPRNSSAFIDSMASVMEQGNARHKAMQDLIDLTLRDTRLRTGNVQSGPLEQIRGLRERAAPSDDDLMFAAAWSARVRKEYG